MINSANRKTGFDIIRILAIFMIFNYHFCTELGLDNSFFCGYKNGGWGSVGTTIFFLLSGYLIHLSSKNSTLTLYAKKRFLSIYPALWLSFIFVYFLTSLKVNNFLWGGEIWRIILSFIGIDTYLQYYFIPTYACVGEWFTGMILFLYVTYILLRILIKKQPVLTTIVITIVYFVESIMGIQPIVPPDASIFTALMLFWLGMLMQEYPVILEATYWKTILALTASVAVMFIHLPFIGNVLPWKNLLGISIFYLLNMIFSKYKCNANTANVLKFISSTSFAVYLVHHFIIKLMVEHFGMQSYMFTYMFSLLISVITAAAITKITDSFKLK